MAQMRLQVTLNGRDLCTAGMDEHGTVSAIVELNRLPGERDPFRPGHTPADEECNEFRVEAQTWTDDALQWVHASIKPGDEIVIRVLGAGTPDAPAKRIPNEVF